MPESKHRRGGQVRPRPRTVEAPYVKPKPSPRWVPILGLALAFAGVGVIIANYIGQWDNLFLVGGFAGLAVGFAVLTQWR